MRFTVRIDAGVHAAAKAYAARTGRTLAAVMEEALRAFLTRKGRHPRQQNRKLPTFGKGGLRPGVSLDSSSDLLDAMEGRERRR